MFVCIEMHVDFALLFVLNQFLGRDKDDGVRRSAVSGKKVWMCYLVVPLFCSCYW